MIETKMVRRDPRLEMRQGPFSCCLSVRAFIWSEVQSLSLLEVKRGLKTTALLGGVTVVCSRITSSVFLSFLPLPSPVCFISFCFLFPFMIRTGPSPGFLPSL